MPCAGLKLRVICACFLASACASQPVAGGDDKRDVMADIRGVIGARLLNIRSCYEKAIEARPGAAGKMVVRWQLGSDGVPSDVMIKYNDATLKDAEECVLAEVRALRFKARVGGEILDIIYPFYFSENGSFSKSGG